jgi:hypothetical protein
VLNEGMTTERIATKWADRDRHFTTERSHLQTYAGIAAMAIVLVIPVVTR